jgi:thiosulfate dehydrogenase [quinone] large subunit
MLASDLKEVGTMAVARERYEAMQMPDVERTSRQHRATSYVWGVLRLLIGFEFLWAFLDKLVGLGFATERADAWVNGGSPASGAVMYALKGPFVGFYETITGGQAVVFGADGTPIGGAPVNAWVDWVYMGAMLLIGLGLMTGVMTRLAAIGGIVWMTIFYTATAIWPEFNPFVDEHVIAAVALVGIAIADAGRYLGLGGLWQRVPFVARHPILR